jgi:peptidoglycan hydrolase-like protein with peptidoglycan-binding domain
MSKYASEVIAVALAEVGYLEKASNKNLDSKTGNAGSANYTKYARDLDAISGFYNGKKNGYAWCDVFVDWCFVKAFGLAEAKSLLCQPDKSYGAGCLYSARYYKEKGLFHSKNPKPGDQIFFWNSKKNDVAHTGLVYKVDSTYVYTVEGNTSSASGVVANGGAVEKKKYKLNYGRIYGYGRPKYDAEPEKAEPSANAYVPTVKEWQLAAIADGYKFPKYGADGEWGAECVSVARKAVVKKRTVYTNKNLTKIVQKVVGVVVDGKCGNNTAAAIRVYQHQNGLTVDGQVGLNTWKKILNI